MNFNNRVIIGLIRIVMAVTLLYSVYWQITDRLAHNLFRPSEYFSYFTITSCLLAGGVLAYSGVAILRNQKETKSATLIRLTVAVSMVIVGVIYNALLAGGDPDPRDIGYAWPVLPNLIMHTYMPIVIFLEWLLFNTDFKIKLKSVFWVLLYPLAWLAFTIIRGLAQGWWPYWFLDPHYGVGTMLTWICVITAFFVVLSIALLPARQLIGRLTSK
jgi:hypothetical protein